MISIEGSDYQKQWQQIRGKYSLKSLIKKSEDGEFV